MKPKSCCEAKAAPYRARLAFEIETIIKMKFPGYFLIVSDFIRWSKEHGIPVGPGRGGGVDPVGEGVEGVGGAGPAGGPAGRLLGGQLARLHPVLLPGPDPPGHAVAGQHDRVGRDVGAAQPGQGGVAQLGQDLAGVDRAPAQVDREPGRAGLGREIPVVLVAVDGAGQEGVELVEGRDLFCRDNSVYMRTTEGERQVDVIYRRIDDDFLDPMQFRPDSVLGVAGLLNAARAGNVVISSAVGNGVGDDKLVYTYVPTIIEYYLGEKQLLANVDTLRCWLDDEREEVLDRIDELVIKPVEGSGGYGIVFGPDASEKELATVRKKILGDPRGWIAQPVVQLSTVPTKVGDSLAPRHVDLRPFAVNDGEDVWVLPGGLTRVALTEGSLVVNSSQGGGSKDTWVLASRSSVAARELVAAEIVRKPPKPVKPPMAERAPEQSGQQQGQQQQQQQQQQAVMR